MKIKSIGNNHISKIKQLLVNDNTAMLISSVANITYLTGYSNFSTEEREAYLFITKNRQYILTDGRYTTAVKKDVKSFEMYEISSKHQFKEALQNLINQQQIKDLGIETSDVSVSEYTVIKKCVSKVSPISLQTLRIKKEPEEIAAIERACQLGDQAFAYILKKIKTNISEKELAWDLEKHIKDNGAELSFKSIVAFGPNAAIPHHQTNNSSLITHNFVLLDFGVKIDNYCSDMTRTVFFGKANDEQKKMYDTVLYAQKKAIEHIQKYFSSSKEAKRLSREDMSSRLGKVPDGTSLRSNSNILTASEVDKVAREYIISQGYSSIPHSLGHGIGLQVHEPPTLSPVSKQVLTEGMVFSIEPGIYIPDFGGVRIEDLFVIEKSRLRQLTKSPVNFIELSL